MMRRVVALTQRELANNFLSPIAYIVAAIFLIATGYLFMSNTLVEGGEASMRWMLNSMAWILVLAIPLLTMRVLSDEYASGTIEPLMTAPVTDVEVVISKFLGVMIFYVALLFTTLAHVVLLYRYSSPDFGVMLYGYFGMLVLGAMYISVGVFASSLTKYQLVAALIAMGILGFFGVVVNGLASWQGGQWRVVLNYINARHHFEDFTKGIFDTKTIVFFCSNTLFFLFLAVKVMESRRWR